MPRPKLPHPTPAELEILKILWDRGPLTVREVLDHTSTQGDSRAYTSVMSLLNVMADKGLLRREPDGRAFRYRPVINRQRALGQLITDVWQRAYEGSTSAMVAHLLSETRPSDTELAEIRRLLERFESSEASE